MKTKHLLWITITVIIAVLIASSLESASGDVSFDSNILKEDFNELGTWIISPEMGVTTTSINPTGQLEQVAAGAMKMTKLLNTEDLFSNIDNFNIAFRVKCESSTSSGIVSLGVVYHWSNTAIETVVLISNGDMARLGRAILDSELAFPNSDTQFHTYTISVDNKAQTCDCLRDGILIFQNKPLIVTSRNLIQSPWPPELVLVATEAVSHWDYVYAGANRSGFTFPPWLIIIAITVLGILAIVAFPIGSGKKDS